MSESEPKFTSFENKCEILSELYLHWRGSEAFADFISYFDLGLPLSFVLSKGIVSSTPEAQKIVNDTFSELLNHLGEEDWDWQSLDDLLISTDRFEVEEVGGVLKVINPNR
jgi:hypothetical protein